MKAAPTLLVAAIALTLAACANDNDSGRQDTAMDTPARDAGRGAPMDTASDAAGRADGNRAPMDTAMPVAEGDRKTLMAVEEVDRHEIAAAEAALAKGVEGDVRDYAQTLLDDHTGNLDATRRLMGRAGSGTTMGGGAAGTGATGPAEQSGAGSAAPADSGVAAMKRKHDAERERLSGMDGEEFASAWIEAMVDGHQEALAKLDNELIPGTDDAEVRRHLQDTRSAVARHLETARGLQSANH